MCIIIKFFPPFLNSPMINFGPPVKPVSCRKQNIHNMWQALGKPGISTKPKKNEFFILIKSYNLSQLSAKILEGKTFDSHRNWQLNWAVFSKAIELEIVKT